MRYRTIFPHSSSTFNNKCQSETKKYFPFCDSTWLTEKHAQHRAAEKGTAHSGKSDVYGYQAVCDESFNHFPQFSLRWICCWLRSLVCSANCFFFALSSLSLPQFQFDTFHSCTYSVHFFRFHPNRSMSKSFVLVVDIASVHVPPSIHRHTEMPLSLDINENTCTDVRRTYTISPLKFHWKCF